MYTYISRYIYIYIHITYSIYAIVHINQKHDSMQTNTRTHIRIYIYIYTHIRTIMYIIIDSLKYFFSLQWFTLCHRDNLGSLEIKFGTWSCSCCTTSRMLARISHVIPPLRSHPQTALWDNHRWNVSSGMTFHHPPLDRWSAGLGKAPRP